MIGFALFHHAALTHQVLALAAGHDRRRRVTAYQLPAPEKNRPCWFLPRINFKDAGAMRVINQMGPAILGVYPSPRSR
ncbi:hypothetical protein ACLFKX_13890 [Enterobacter hormaechei]